MLLLPLSLLAAISWFALHTGGTLTSDEQNFTEPMVRCLKEGKVYWPKQNSCHELPDLTVCGKRHWLVLDLEKINQTNFLEPVCKPMPCTKQLHVYWPASDACVSNREAKNLCPKDNKLKDDVYGEGTCTCQDGLLPLSATVGTSECSRPYERQPCPEGQILLARYVDDFGLIAECQEDPCAKNYTSDAKEQGTLALDPVTKKCHPLDSLGPCSETGGERYKVSPLSHLPDCIEAPELSILNGPRRCPMYANGTCKEPIVVESETVEWTRTSINNARRQKLWRL